MAVLYLPELTAVLGIAEVKASVSVYSAWPFFACMAVLLAVAATPVLAPANRITDSRRNRVPTLDGLRGFLALAVFFHHTAVYHAFLLDGSWQPPPSRFYVLLGQVGVALFFMITGYLFWSQVVEKRGRPDWLRLYVGRVFRIGPLYLFAVVIMFGIVLMRTGLHLNVPFVTLMQQVGKWLNLGFAQGPNVNGYDNTGLLLAGVTWTLHYEWLFYLSLPLTALAARQSWMHLCFALAGLAVSIGYSAWDTGFSHISVVFAALFFLGMTCASMQLHGLNARLPDWLASGLVLVFSVLVFGFFPDAHRPVPMLLMGLAFYLIASGCTVFGLLSSRAARHLGDMSYSIYLLQGLVLALVFSFDSMRWLVLTSIWRHWAIMLFCAVVLVLVAKITHTWVEQIGIGLGKQIDAKLRGKLPATANVECRRG